MILGARASSNRDWATQLDSLIRRPFTHDICSRSDAVVIYWIRPGREPARDWTRRMRL